MLQSSEKSLSSNSDKEVDKQLEQIRLATPQYEIIKVGENPDEWTLTVSLPHMCSITGILTDQTSATNECLIYINMFNLPEEFQQKGIGQRLLRSLVACAKTYGATELSGNVTSKSALKTRARVFGQEKLSYFRRTGLGQKGEKIDRTYDEILSRLPNSIIEADENVDFSCFVDVDLKEIDTQSWELPILKQSENVKRS